MIDHGSPLPANWRSIARRAADGHEVRWSARDLLRLLMAAFGPSRHLALPHELGRYRDKADVESRRRFYGYTA